MSSDRAKDRVYNFSAGPANLPLSVLQKAQRDLLSLPGVGASILEISHRSRAFLEILADAEERLRTLLEIPEGYEVLFLQAGSRLQFSMVPMNLLRPVGAPAEYVVTGSWGKKAFEQARLVGDVNVVWDGQESNYDRLPPSDELMFSETAAYVHTTSNETIQGVQFAADLDAGAAPLVADMSSDFLSRPINVSKYGLIYACAQKNAGPAGVTIVIVRNDLLLRSDDRLPGYLNYQEHAKSGSLYNTPCTFGIYLVGLVAKWLQEEIGGLAAMQRVNRGKAALLYDLIDSSEDFYIGHAQADCRSLMNVTFRLPSVELTRQFVEEAAATGLDQLQGHRSVGGIRASIYNAMPTAGVESLHDFMRDFRIRNA